MRAQLPLILGTLGGLIVIFSQYFFPGQQLDLINTTDKWYTVSFNIAIGLGVVNLTRVHVNHIRRRRETWPFSVVLLVGMYAYMVLGLIQTVEGPQADWIFDNVLDPIDSTMYSLLAFYITSAAFRAFRVRTREAGVLLLAAAITALGQAPVGDSIVDGWFAVADWINKTFTTGAYRGILLAAGIGAFATAMRVLLGLERAHIGGLR